MKRSLLPNLRLAMPLMATVPSLLTAATDIWDGGGGTDTAWSTATNWVGDTALASDGTEDVAFTSISANNTLSLGADYWVKTLSFGSGTFSYAAVGSYTIAGGNTLTLEGQGGADTLALDFYSSSTNPALIINSDLAFSSTGAGGVIRTIFGTLTLNGNFNLNGKAVRFQAASTGTMILNGVISGTTSSAVFRNTSNGNGGSIYINALNTYSGPTINYNANLIVTQNSLSGQAGAFGNSTSSLSLGTSANSITGDAAILTGGAVEIGRSITVAANGSTTTTKALTLGGNTADVSVFSGTITVNSDLASKGLQLTAASGGRVNFTGSINRGTVTTGTYDSVTKIGAGVVALSASSYSYQGATSVDAGTLLVNGTLTAAGSGVVTVKSGATLGGNGTINRATTVQSGATFSPGDLDASFVSQADSLDFGASLVFESGSSLKFDLGTVSDTVSVTGNLTLEGTLDINALAGFGVGQYKLFSYAGTFLDNGLALGSTPAGYNYSIVNSAGTGEVFLNVTSSNIPEPGNAALGAGAITIIGALMRRRRR